MSMRFVADRIASSTDPEYAMNMNSPRLNDKVNGVALATILAIVVSIMCACVSIMVDSGAYATAQAKSPSKIVATAGVAVVRR
jgi:hypothetical protein